MKITIRTERISYGTLRIVTNGTVVPKAGTLRVLKECGVFVKISDYNDISKKRDELAGVLDVYEIPYQTDKVEWCEVQQLMEIPRNGSEEVFSKCIAKNICCAVMNGRFYRCAFLAYGEDCGAIPYSEENSFDLMDNKFGKGEFYEYVNRKRAVPGCDYCTSGDYDGPKVPAAEQTKEPLPYRIFENYPPDFK